MDGAVDRRRQDRVARCFGPRGRLRRWPARRADQDLILWILWSQLPGEGQMTELDVNAMLRTWHDFEDYVLLRRELCDADFLRRTPDGRIYRRVARPVPAEIAALIERVENLPG